MIELGVFEVMGFVKGRNGVGLGVGGSPRVMEENDKEEVVVKTWMGRRVGT